MITVAIVDDHSVVRFGIRYILQLDKELKLVAEAENGEQAVDLVKKNHPDIVLMDIRMPGAGGISALEAVLKVSPATKVIMLTTSDLDEDIYRSIRGGAKGYMLKDLEPKLMVAAIRDVAAGGTYFPKEIQAQYDVRSSSKDLTPREQEVLGLLVKGLSNPDIARVLSISPNSVKIHLKHIFEKLDVQDRAEAAAAALRRGIIKS